MEEDHELDILEIRDTTESFTVKALIDGEVFTHSFPYIDRFFKEDEDGIPYFLVKMAEIKEKRDKRKSQKVCDKCSVDIDKHYSLKSDPDDEE